MPDDTVLRAEWGGKKPQNRTVPRQNWRMRDWIKVGFGRPPRFTQHSPAWFVRRSLPAEVWDSYYKFSIERNSWDIGVSAYWWYQHRHRLGISFRDFIQSDALKTYSNWRLYTINNEIALDEVIRYEHLAESLDVLSKRLGLPDLRLPEAKSGYRPRAPYGEMYDPSTQRRVAEVFSKEIQAFGWVF